MSNMSYCRFENTDRDLADCQAALEDFTIGEGDELSRDELAAAKSLVERCKAIVELISEYVGEDVDLDAIDHEEALDDMMDSLDPIEGGA